MEEGIIGLEVLMFSYEYFLRYCGLGWQSVADAVFGLRWVLGRGSRKCSWLINGLDYSAEISHSFLQHVWGHYHRELAKSVMVRWGTLDVLTWNDPNAKKKDNNEIIHF